MESAIAELVHTHAVVEVPFIPHVVNLLSVSIQSSGKKRLILDLRHVNHFIWKQKFIRCEDWRVSLSYVTSQAKTFRTLSRFYTDSRSPAVHQPFERTGMPFERLELTVLKNSSFVRTVRAMRSTKLISRSTGSSYPFEKIHQPFERLELSVRENLSAVRTARAIRSRKFISRLNG